ncbi:MAG: TIGR04086 family membrane protein [Ruminococcaceae bacterium]|nr:TIGR04086 family membrane protein [Oscillospiraceae bacterium]
MIKRKAKYPVLRKLKPFIKGTVAGFIVTLLMTLLFSFVICALSVDESMYAIIALIATGVGCYVDGILIGGGKGRNGFFWGAVGGIIFFIIYAAGAVIIGNTDGSQLIAKLLCCVICSMAGGITGVNIELNN